MVEPHWLSLASESTLIPFCFCWQGKLDNVRYSILWSDQNLWRLLPQYSAHFQLFPSGKGFETHVAPLTKQMCTA